MKQVQRLAFAGIALLAVLGCNRPKAIHSVAKAAPVQVPGGTLTLAFTRKVQGPLELTLDGVRIPVKQGPKGGKTLLVAGIAEGRHRYFIESNRDAFGPDQGDLEMSATQGVYYVIFAQRFESVLYGKNAPTPPAEGLPGVSAILK
ncbi:MAG: hypothetical protein KGN80_09125 [Acidobacteriota bacterium]|nr:hypothetical protein [Acidobacteriota bacterium]